MNNASESPRRALGKGLSALLPVRQAAAAQVAQAADNHSITEVEIDLIDPNPMQPRTAFRQDRLSELAQSIGSHGVIQPLVVRRKGARFQLIAGERRWRAAKLAGLSSVPVVVSDVPDDQLLEITLIENIQREDLNPIEVAIAFDRLARELHLSHEEIGRRTGKDRTTITNMLRLLKLPADVQALVAEHRLSMGHARSILGLPNVDLQRQVAEKVAAQGLSVRQVERLVQRMTETREPASAEKVEQDPNVKAAAEQLERLLGTRVRIVERSGEQGRIEIEYYSPADLDRLYTIIAGSDR